MKNELINHLEKLKYFKTVADEGSFYKASLKLGISQPALTRSVQTLEAVLDLIVFNRSRRGIQMTAQGLELLGLANDLFSKVEAWQVSTDEKLNPLKILRLGTYDNLATSLFPAIIKRLESELESLDFKLTAGPSNAFLTLELLEKKLDYILLAEPQRHRGISYQSIANEEYGFFASTQFLAKSSLKDDSITTSELKKLRLLTIPGAIAGISKTIDRLLWEISVSKVSEFNSFEVVKSAMLQNLGLALIPSLSVWKEVKNKSVRQVFVKGLPRTKLGVHKMYLCSRSQYNEAEFAYVAEKIQAVVNDLRFG